MWSAKYNSGAPSDDDEEDPSSAAARSAPEHPDNDDDDDHAEAVSALASFSRGGHPAAAASAASATGDDDDDDGRGVEHSQLAQQALHAYNEEQRRRQKEDERNQAQSALHEYQRQHAHDGGDADHSDNNDGDDDDDDAMDVDDSPSKRAASQQPPQQPRGKPEAMARAFSAARVEEMEAEQREAEAAAVATMPAKASPKKRSRSPASKSKSSSSAARGGSNARKRSPARRKLPAKLPVMGTDKTTVTRLLGEPVPDITEDEYVNLESLMVQFCRVPLLAEFSRPVALLHPELESAYSKIVEHAVDLGHVCRGIRRRLYRNTRDIRLDMWRVFANCVQFHSHPNNKEAVPSFVSIALHLREYFNSLWQEYMLPSDQPTGASASVVASFSQRDDDRKKRAENSGVLILTKPFMAKTSRLLAALIDSGGCVDTLDKEPVFGPSASVKNRELDVVVMNLKSFQSSLEQRSRSDAEYTFADLISGIQRCYTVEVLEDDPALRNRVGSRVLRFLGKICVPLHEANSRGVTQSSIWGNLAATIWARESSKKPYWPALCLGILPPEEQREGWHEAVTLRNELRLPEKLRLQLSVAKKKCEHAQKKQQLSYFLVEFLGTHEFIWVRETDIVENFDPKEDPNKNVGLSKKKRSGRHGAASVIGSKTYQAALEECTWANEEFESVLQDAFDYVTEDEEGEDDSEEMNYSYSLLSQSDDEADEVDEKGGHGYQYDEKSMSASDLDEAHWLLTHDGMIDTSATGRKNAKKRILSMKKKAEAAEKRRTDASNRKVAADSAKKSRANQLKRSRAEQVKKKQNVLKRDAEKKKAQRELESRRKKRTRAHDKMLRAQSSKRRRGPQLDDEADERGLVRDKRARSSAIVRAYLTRMADSGEYNAMGLAGVLSIPSSMVDSTGLLGMTLAFRSAAGELIMPDDYEENEAKAKPWLAIDVCSPPSVAEREKRLETKVGLLEKEVQRLRSDTARRRELTEEAFAQRRALERAIMSDDAAARLNPWRRRKTVPSSASGEGGKDEKAPPQK